MLLEKECEELTVWFDKTFARGKIKIHQGMNEANPPSEEYHIHFSVNGKHFASELRVPTGGDDPVNAEFVSLFRRKFLEVQKSKITKAMITVAN